MVRKKPRTNDESPASPSADEGASDGAPELTMLSADGTPDLAVILTAISDMSKKMDDGFQALEVSLQITQATLTEHGQRIATVEEASSDHDTRLSILEQQGLRLENANKLLQDKVIDLEARSRRQNIKVVGLPERAEGGRPTEFFASFIKDLLGAENFPNPIEIDRAHRLGAQPATDPARPRVMIAKIHSYRLKDQLMRLSQQKYPLSYKGKRIHIFPDLPAEIMKRRQLFEDARKRLREAGLRTGFIYPARLRVTQGTDTSILNTPEEAKRFADNMPGRSVAPV